MATRVDLKGIKDDLKSLFDTANTTTASPIDLSQNMQARVQTVFTIHPEKIPIQASLIPYVTCYVSSKEIESKTIGLNQMNVNRKAEIDVRIMGVVWNDTFTSVTEDPADNDINYLMENIELILRSNSNVNGKVLWQVPSGVEYFTANPNEQTHLRAGILSVKATTFY
jgi:hypothetical protein